MKKYWPVSLVLLVALQLAVPRAWAQGRPFRGSVKWSVLLCRFSDGGALPHAASFYRDMFVNGGTGGLADYWDDISYGGIDLNGSEVRGWYSMNITVAQGNALDRWGRVDACVNAARNAPTNAYQVPAGNRVAVITFPAIDMFGWDGGAFLPHDVDVGGMAHEVGHGISLGHSFSDDPTYRNADWAAIGEYDDPWDVMSWGNAFRVPTLQFGDGPVGLNGFHRDRMGWLPRHRILTFGADGASSRTLTLAALDHPEAGGFLLVRVPFDPGDLNRYYTLELRRRTTWDAGIPADIVLLHEVKKRDDGVYYSFLLRERTGDRNPVQSVNANGVTISVNSINAGASQASVTVTSGFVDRCLQGFVWREASPSDHVCVTPAVRSETRDENAQAASRREPGGGPFGPDTCRQGFVWREAFPNDHVCVPPASRSRAAADNAAAASRRNPAQQVFGPNTCRQGFVWREADARDWVCVTPQVRSQTSADNAQAAARRNPGGGAFGPDTCLVGFVWREAFPGDHVCVPPATRTEARNDNAQASSRLAYP
jgi:hypothetical protein